MSSEVTVVVKNPYATSDSFYIAVPPTFRVIDLKKRLSLSYPSRPAVDSQRIIHCGRLCGDDDTLHSLASNSADEHRTVTLHLAIKNIDGGTPQTTANATPFPSPFPPPMMMIPPTPYAMMNTTPFQYGYYYPYQMPPYAPLMPMTLPTQQQTSTATALYDTTLRHSPTSNVLRHRTVTATSDTALPPRPSPSPSPPPASTVVPPSATTQPTANTAVPPAQPQNVAAAPAAAAPLLVMNNAALLRRYFDLTLMLKLAVLFFFLYHDGDTYRTIILIAIAVGAYLYQVGLLRFIGIGGGRPDVEAPAGEAAAAGAPGNAANNVANGRREGGAGGLGGMFGGDEEDDAEFEREQMEILAAQHRAEQIRMGRPIDGSDAQANGAAIIQLSWIATIERFVVGLFASLIPSWRPTL